MLKLFATLLDFITHCFCCKESADPQRSPNSAGSGMFSKMPYTPITVITVFALIGRVLSQDPPPTIHDRACYIPGEATAPVADCQSAIDKLAGQTAIIDGPTISCLETAWSGSCGINICSNVNVRPQAIAATAQDIFSGCRSSGKGSTVGGYMTMSGFGISSTGGLNGVNGLATPSTGGVGGDITITMRTRLVGGSKRNVGDIGDTHPTRIHAKDLSVPHRVEARDPAPTWEAGGGYELVLLDSQNPGWRIDPGLATTLASNLRNNWGVQPGTHFTAYDQQQMGTATVANGFYAASNYELADVDPDHRFPLAAALHAFRNQQGNPGWFAVQVLSNGHTIGDMFFDLTQQGGLNLL